MALNIYFDHAKTALEIERDAVLARRLGISPQNLNRARKHGWCPDDVLVQLHEILGTSMEELVLAREAAKEGVMQPAWQRAYQTVKRASAAVGIGAALIGGLHATDAHTSAGANSMQVIDLSNKNYRK